MNDMIIEVLGPHEKVSENASAVRDLGPEGVVQARRRGHGVHGKAHAAEPAGDVTGIPGVLAREERLEATGHGAAAPGVLDHAVLDLYVDLEMSLDPGDRINCYSLAH